jgi:HEAT repeat protein
MRQVGIIGSERAVNPLLVILKDRDWVMRNHAAEALGEIGDPRAINGLITALEDPHSYVRSNAITALGNLKATAALELLVLKLQDPDIFVRSAAASALGTLGCDRAVEGLIIGLQDPDPIVRWTFAEALGDICNEQALEPLIQALQDVHIMVRKTAIFALGKIGNEQAIEPLTAILTNSDSSLRRAAIFSLYKIGGELPIQALLGDGDVQVRELAARTLLNTAVLEQPVRSLLNELQNPYSIVRAESARLLGEMSADILATIGIDRVVNAIAVLLNDLSFKVRKIAVIALGKIGSDLASEPLISALQNLNNHRHLRRNAVFALEKIGTERVFHPITLALKDSIPCVRIAAVSSLSRIGGERAIDLFLTALRDPYWQGRKSARYVCNTLVKIGGVRVEEELLNALHNPNTSRFVRRSIISLLPQIGTNKSSDTLISLIANSRGWIKLMAIGTLYQIIERASERGRISTIIELLIATLCDGQAKVRKAVVYQLAFIVDSPQYANYLEPIVPALAVAVGDINEDVRRKAITTLAKITSPNVFDCLIKALTHSDFLVAQQAVEELGKILHKKTILKLSSIFLTNAQITLAISGLRTASTDSKWQVSKTAKEILTQLHI